MKKQELLRKLAQLETKEDYLQAELDYLNELLKKVGFERGILTLKAAAEAIVASSS